MRRTYRGWWVAALVACCLPAFAQSGDGMVAVPAGPFVMGTDDGPDDERPRHSVTLAAFRIDRFPVTNADFAAFLNVVAPDGRRPVNAGGERLFDEDDNDARIHFRIGHWRAHDGFARHPVVEVSWPGARDYCAWRGGRLPTEAEWEKSARGTDARRYPWGNDPPDPTRAHYLGGWNDTAPIGDRSRGASPYGAIDMAGNGWEWVSSLYRPYPYRTDDGREDLRAAGVRGTRGGGHDARVEELTTTHRGRFVSRAPQAGHHNIGFRCAR